jgi:membrane-associated phospholipid phosphatase
MEKHAGKKQERVIADCGFQDAAPRIATVQRDVNLFVNRKRLLFWVLGGIIAVVLIALAFHFDELVHNYIATHPNQALRSFMQKVSRFGDWPEHVALGLILAGAAWLRGNKKWTRIFLAMLIACALAGAAARVTKIAVGRARPSVQTETAWNGPSLSSKFNAFPSGHTAASTAFFAVLLFVYWRIGLACLPIPILIGFSRMYVAAHYLSDVLSAAILGVICAFLVARLLRSQIEI